MHLIYNMKHMPKAANNRPVILLRGQSNFNSRFCFQFIKSRIKRHILIDFALF